MSAFITMGVNTYESRATWFCVAFSVALTLVLVLSCSSSDTSNETHEEERAIAIVANYIYESEQAEHLARLLAGTRSMEPFRPNTANWRAETTVNGGWRVTTSQDGIWLVEDEVESPTYLRPSPTATPSRSSANQSATPTAVPYVIVNVPSPTSTPRPTPTPYPPNTFPLGEQYDDPPQIVIAQGTTVTWINDSLSPQSIDACLDKYCLEFGGTWASGEIQPGGTFSYTFRQLGTFYYRKNESVSYASFILVTSNSGAQSTQEETHSASASGSSHDQTTGCPVDSPEYGHPQGKWSNCLPTAWTFAPVPGEEAWDTYGAVSTNGGDLSGLLISEIPGYGVNDLEAIMNTLIDLMEGKSLAFEVVLYEIVDLNDREAYFLEADYVSGTGKSMRRYMLTVSGNYNVYYLEAFAPSNMWSSRVDTYERILGSFLIP